MNLLSQIAIFIIFLGPLVFFHELGHFLFARFFGVRVEVFSLGFGPKLFKFQRGDTQYVASLIPLGGYVKMFGDDPTKKDEISEEDKKYSFTHKPKWSKFWIIFGGPLANFILAYFIYFALLVGGEKVPEPKLGLIPANSQYYQIGFRTADVLKMINTQEVLGFDDLNLVDSNIDTVTVQRGTETIKIEVGYPSQKFVRDLMSFAPHFRAPVFTDLKGQRFILSDIQGAGNLSSSLEEFERLDTKKFYLYPLNKEESGGTYKEDFSKEKVITIDKSFYKELVGYGYYPVDLVVSSIVMDSAADKSLLKKGDIIYKVDGITLFSFNTLRESIQKVKKGGSAKIEYYRDGKLLSSSLTPEVKEVGGKDVMVIGVYSSVQPSKPRMIESSKKSFASSITLAFSRTIEGMEKTVMGFVKLITAQASMKNIGGPIAIAKVAADSLGISLSYFFRLMAIISINLGIINLFPIPVLDGGHILFLFLEVLNRGPLSEKKMAVAQQFGLSLLLILITVALYNDFYRLFS